MLIDLTSRRKMPIVIVEVLKVFQHPPPPLKRESSNRIVDLIIQNIVVLSIRKTGGVKIIFFFRLPKSRIIDWLLKSGHLE